MSARTPARPRPANNRRARQAARDRRRRRWSLLGALAAGLGILAAVAAAAFAGGGSPAAGFSANKAAFDLPALTGNGHVRLAAFRGRPVVVNFFASWCVYCNEELPGFVQVAQATRGRVGFIGVDSDDTGNGAAMARRFGLSGAGFSLARDIGPAPASQLWSAFGGQGLPVTAFYDGSGRLVDFSGGMLTQAQLEARLKQDFGVDVHAADASSVLTPVIPVIARGAFELIRSYLGDPTWVTLDLRSPAAFAAGHVPYAQDLDSAAADFRARLSRLDRAANYIVYGATAGQTTSGAEVMHRLGFKHVYAVEGGFSAWTGTGLPVSG